MRYWKIPAGLLALVLAAHDPATPWIKTRQRLTILSANDGQSHLRLNADMKLDRDYVTKDSITSFTWARTTRPSSRQCTAPYPTRLPDRPTWP